MKIRKFCTGITLFILLIFLSNPFHLSIFASQQAQLYANYILVENVEGMGFLEGEVVGMPLVDDNGVTGLLRVHNKTGWWVGLTVNEHNTKVKSVDIADALQCPTAQLIPPNGYRDFSSHFSLEDDFVTFVFDNKNWATLANMWEAFIDGMPQSSAFSKDAVAKAIIDIITLQCLEAPQLVKGDLKTAIKNEYMQKKIVEILKKNLSIELSEKTLTSAIGGFVKVWKIKDLLSRIRESGQVFVAYKLSHDTAPSVTFKGLRIGKRNISEQTKSSCVYYIPYDEKNVVDKIKGFIPFLKEVEKIQNYKEKQCGQSDSISRNQNLSVPASLVEGWKTYKNQELGFEFQYPPELGELKEFPKEDFTLGHLAFITKDDPNPNNSPIKVYVYTKETVEGWSPEGHYEGKSIVHPFSMSELLLSKPVGYDCLDAFNEEMIKYGYKDDGGNRCRIAEVNGQKVFKVAERVIVSSGVIYEYLFVKNNIWYDFEFYDSIQPMVKDAPQMNLEEYAEKEKARLDGFVMGNLGIPLDRNYEFFEKIISTVQFKN